MGAGVVRIAAIVYGDGVNANAILEEFACHLLASGRRVRGLIQRRAGAERRCSGDVFLIDLAGDDDFRISQNLGAESTCCSIDPAGIAAASVVLRRAQSQPVDLLVVNKFGKLEAEGGGFVAEILSAAAQGIPVVTTVHERRLECWREFTGDLSQQLFPSLASTLNWWQAGSPRQPAVCV